MLEYDGPEVSEGIDVRKTDGLGKSIIHHYQYFLIVNLRFQPGVCNGCHDLMGKAVNFNDATIATVKGNNYTILFLYMSKDEAISLLRNEDLTEKVEHYKT